MYGKALSITGYDNPIKITLDQHQNRINMKKESESSSSSHESSKGRERSSTGKKKTYTKEESDSLRELFLHELKDIYWAEKELVKALPKMIKKASTPELAEAITKHLDETHNHVERLEAVFEELGEKAKAEKCEGMKGLLDEAEEIVGEFKEGKVRDAAMIAAAQKVEHYEISAYGTLIAFARHLGEDGVVKHLQDTLNEEKAADEKLTEIALSEVNPDA
jgi:ferritin-like metal-binding protein YciE